MLAEKFAKGIFWMGSLRFSTRVVSYLKLAVLARIFTPADFGVVGIASLVLAFLEIVTETGINTILIQEKKLETYINSAWLISIFRGIIISVAIILLTPYIAIFFNSPESKSLLYLISIVPFLRGFINPAEITFQKNLNFGKEFYFRFPIFFSEALVSVLFAVLTRRPESFIYGFIFSAFFEVLLSFAVLKVRPRLTFDTPTIKFILSNGKWLTGNGILQYLFRQGDDMVVGKFLGSVSLGFYQQAYKISALPLTEIADVVSKATFPIYSSIDHSLAELRRAFVKTLSLVVLLSGISGLVIYQFADLVVLILLGRNWLEIVPILKILVLFGVFRSITFSINSVLLSLKKQKYVSMVSFVETATLAILIFPLLGFYGLSGVAYACVIATIIGASFSGMVVLRVFSKQS